jgi:hypothetical protein
VPSAGMAPGPGLELEAHRRREHRESRRPSRGTSLCGSGAWTRTRITSSKGWRATNCTTPELLTEIVADIVSICSPGEAQHCSRLPPRPQFVRLLNATRRGEVSERFKEHAWKACVGETQPWVRIPPSPPFWRSQNALSEQSESKGSRGNPASSAPHGEEILQQCC